MKASELSIVKLLEWTRQFKIPIYQRKYSWTNKQCKQLFNDIMKVWTDQNISTHFIWWVIYTQEWVATISEVNELIIIDWQQRLTTIVLLLKALADCYLKNWEEKAYNKIMNRYLFNIETEWENKFKIYPTKSDKDIFFGILNNQTDNISKDSLIYSNYNFFKSSIEKNIENIDEIYEWLWKLFVIEISLDRNYDNPQLIFESMNSTWLELSKSDLIRNYVLMWLEPDEQKNLYETYWYPMEYNFGNDTEGFDNFFRDYLTFKSQAGRIPTFAYIYEEFKDYINNTNTHIEDILKDIYYYSKIYTKIIWLKKEEDKELSKKLEDIRELKAEVSYPLIMEVFSDYEQNVVSKSTFVKILSLIESYVFRRNICWIPTASMSRTFSTFKRYISKESEEKCYESLLAHFLLLEGSRRFPRDAEFEENFIVKDVYNYRNSRYLLSRLENFNTKEKTPVEDYTIEHIIPQNPNLSEEWKKQLWENRKQIQEKYLHTIWNLTLTWYNPEYSDRSFQEKKKMEWWFDDSPIRLNEYIKNRDNWNENAILDRAKQLADKAKKIWIFESLSQEILNLYKDTGSEDAGEYEVEDFFDEWMENLKDLFYDFDKKIKNLDDSIFHKPTKNYIWYKIGSLMVCSLDIKNSFIRLNLFWLDYENFYDPENLLKNIYRGYWLDISKQEDVDYWIESIKKILENKSF